MDKSTRNLIFSQAKEWVLEAGANIRKKINEPMVINTKSNPNDLVTETDKETEKFFADNIRGKYPRHLLLGEEGYGDDVSSLNGIVWIIDPIDGTMNFVHLKKHFAISIGIFHNGIGEIGLIYDVMADVLYSAQKGEGAYKNDVKLKRLSENVLLEESIFAFNHNLLCESSDFDRNIIESLVNNIRGCRIIGAAALDIAHVAEGIFDGFISKGLSPWDVAGGTVILNEVGGITSRNTGARINMLDRGTVVACNKALHEKLVENYFSEWKNDS